MLEILRRDDADLVIASRYLTPNAKVAGLDRWRTMASRIANRLAQQVLRTKVTDPVCGFFMIRRAEIDRLAPRLSPTGFKILFDIVASARGRLRVQELPYLFSPRLMGESKLDGKVALNYLGLVLSKLTRGPYFPKGVSLRLGRCKRCDRSHGGAAVRPQPRFHKGPRFWRPGSP